MVSGRRAHRLHWRLSTPNIQVVSLADLSVYNLTGGQGFDWAPAWSPDGSSIAFVSDRTGTQELYRVNTDGTGLVRLTTAIGFNGRFAWSPDGRTIALARDIAGVSDLYRINPDGSSSVRLTSGLGGIGEIEWSSDSTRILFDCGTEVCVINANATGFARLTASSGRSAVFAPGDGRIAFVTTSFGPAAEIAVRHEDGTIVRVAAGTPGTNPVWSPDGASLMFEGTNPIGYEGGCCGGGACNADWSSYCTPLYGLYTVDAVGSNLRLLGRGSNPDWLRARPGQPLASFTHHCTGSSCDFDATGSTDPDGAIVSYAWRLGDATNSTGSTISHTYTAGGTFLVTLTVTDNDGTTSAVSRQIVANAAPTATFVVKCASGLMHVRRVRLGRCRRNDHVLRVDVRRWSDALPTRGHRHRHAQLQDRHVHRAARRQRQRRRQCDGERHRADGQSSAGGIVRQDL